jgi:hypothetical protein
MYLLSILYIIAGHPPVLVNVDHLRFRSVQACARFAAGVADDEAHGPDHFHGAVRCSNGNPYDTVAVRF